MNGTPQAVQPADETEKAPGTTPPVSPTPNSGSGPRVEKMKKGDHLVWLGGACAATTLGLFATLVIVVLVHGLGTFWVDRFTLFSFKDGTKVLGAERAREPEKNEIQLYIANRDLNGLDFRWLPLEGLTGSEVPADVVVFERIERGNFVGFIQSLRIGADTIQGTQEELWTKLVTARQQMDKHLAVDHELEQRLTQLNLAIAETEIELNAIRDANRRTLLQEEQNKRRGQADSLSASLDSGRAELRQTVAAMVDGSGKTLEVPLMEIVHAYRPNRMSVIDKTGFYVKKVGELVWENPRESNTEGGLYPAILGTVLMVMLMSVFCVPLGVIAAIYLREYAREGLLLNLVRIAVNNLAGVPSIVYGMFGLGFFVYGIGGTLDDLFFSDRLPLPTFGTGGLLWASLTMALLTVPVVIVSTEEGLGAVPQGVRYGSLALGATKFQTLTRVVLPMATPGILTGLILAIARAAGEVAPLMLVGVVKSTQSMPLSGEFPYLRLDHKIMHLGFHIYDVGFQSPNVEAAKPMVYVTTLLLLILVLGMSFLAMYLRNRMKKRYTLGAF